MDKQMSSIYTMEYYSALKRKQILTYATTWMNFEDIMLSEINQSQKGQILYDPTYMRSLEESNSQRQKVEWWLPGAGWREEWGVIVEGIEFLFGKMKKFWR